MSGSFKVRFWLPLLLLLIASFIVTCTSPAGPSGANRANIEQPATLPASLEKATPFKQAWEKEWDNVQANARKEGGIVIYGAPGVAPVTP